MTAAALMGEARAAGVELRLVDGVPCLRGPAPAELRAALREHMAEVVQLLAGERCRWCAALLPWPEPGGIVLGDGTAECHACGDREVWRLLVAADRAVNSPDALADPAELMIRGKSLP